MWENFCFLLHFKITQTRFGFSFFFFLFFLLLFVNECHMVVKAILKIHHSHTICVYGLALCNQHTHTHHRRNARNMANIKGKQIGKCKVKKKKIISHLFAMLFSLLAFFYVLLSFLFKLQYIFFCLFCLLFNFDKRKQTILFCCLFSFRIIIYLFIYFVDCFRISFRCIFVYMQLP